MDVSNSSGSNTDYRVMAGGQAPRPSKGGPGKEKVVKPVVQPLHSGTLEPNTYITLQMPDTAACKVEFHRAGKKVAEQTVKEGNHEEVLVALVPNGKGAPTAFACRRKA